MKNWLPFIICVAGIAGAQAQVAEHQVIDRGGNNGTLTYTFQHDEIHGTQFLIDTWFDANITNEQNYTFRHFSVKFDVYNNKFVYNVNDTAYELGPGVKMVCLFPNPADTAQKMVYKSGYEIDRKITARKFLQVLAEGNTSLLKYSYKELEEYSEYGNAVRLKRFKDLDQYYILAGGRYIAVSINRKSLQQVLQDKWTQVKPWLEQKNMSGRDQAGWVAAIVYYNSL